MYTHISICIYICIYIYIYAWILRRYATVGRTGTFPDDGATDEQYQFKARKRQIERDTQMGG